MSAVPCQYIHHATENIHEFVFYEPGSAAVDVYLNTLRGLFTTWLAQPDRPLLRILYDVTRSGMFDMDYAIEHFGRLKAEFAESPTPRLAYLFADTAAAPDFIAKGSDPTVGRRVFAAGQRAEAVRWLSAP